MIVYDDLEPSEKVRVYDKGIDVVSSSEGVYEMLINYRTGDMWSPKLDLTEALHAEVRHFQACIEGRERAVTDGQAGLRMVKILEAACESMRDQGRLVPLSLDGAS